MSDKGMHDTSSVNVMERAGHFFSSALVLPLSKALHHIHTFP
jgi:hypothetical protein